MVPKIVSYNERLASIRSVFSNVLVFNGEERPSLSCTAHTPSYVWIFVFKFPFDNLLFCYDKAFARFDVCHYDIVQGRIVVDPPFIKMNLPGELIGIRQLGDVLRVVTSGITWVLDITFSEDGCVVSKKYRSTVFNISENSCVVWIKDDLIALQEKYRGTLFLLKLNDDGSGTLFTLNDFCQHVFFQDRLLLVNFFNNRVLGIDYDRLYEVILQQSTSPLCKGLSEKLDLSMYAGYLGVYRKEADISFWNTSKLLLSFPISNIASIVVDRFPLAAAVFIQSEPDAFDLITCEMLFGKEENARRSLGVNNPIAMFSIVRDRSDATTAITASFPHPVDVSYG